MYLNLYIDFSYEFLSIYDKNLLNGVGLNLDVGVVKWIFGFGVCFIGFFRVIVVFDRLVYCYVVR